VKYLLVFVDTFSGWVQSFPTTNKRAQSLITSWEIIPRFGVPALLQSDNGPELTSQASQTLSKALNIPWHFHIPYHPQSSGNIERTRCSLKTTLVKLSQELNLDWANVWLFLHYGLFPSNLFYFFLIFIYYM
jgi:transposase InsO family protein